MEIVPPLRVTRFEQLEPGDLFVYMEEKQRFFALKTQPREAGGRGMMVVLGPAFPPESREAFLAEWRATTVLSLGKSFSILPSLDPTAWALSTSIREPVYLAVADKSVYVCANGGRSPEHYIPWFVDIRTGAIREGRLPSSAAFTNKWELAVLSAEHPPRTVLRFPLQ